MNRAILWFAVLYGELTSAVILVVLAGYAVETQTGQRLCEKTGMDLLGCKSAAGLSILVLTGYAAYHSFRRFMLARKDSERGNSAQ